jgi:hypothetical protein
MIMLESMPTTDDPRPVLGPGDSQVLAAALAHLLGRDGELPARWRTPAFTAAVEAARTGSRPRGVGRPDDRPLDFQGAAMRLSREPQDVAVAIRQLEHAAHRPLPAWGDLVRRGLPASPSPLDTALWFG